MRLCSIDVGVKNLAFVVLDVHSAHSAHSAHSPHSLPAGSGSAVTVRAWVSASTVPATTCVRGMCKMEAIEAVFRALDERADELLECDTVLIEAQPRFSPLNAQTAHAIAAYFVLRKRVDMDEGVAVHLVHASRKNAWARVGALPVPALAAQKPKRAGSKAGLVPVLTRSAKYQRNKTDAVDACAEVVARGGCARVARAWAAFRKKDDAADAMLQALAWLGHPRSVARVVGSDFF